MLFAALATRRSTLTRNYFPHIQEPALGLLIDIGCQRRGIGLQTRMGQALASYVHSGDRSVLPVAPTDIKAFPLYVLRRAYVAAAIAWYKMY